MLHSPYFIVTGEEIFTTMEEIALLLYFDTSSADREENFPAAGYMLKHDCSAFILILIGLDSSAMF